VTFIDINKFHISYDIDNDRSGKRIKRKFTILQNNLFYYGLEVIKEMSFDFEKLYKLHIFEMLKDDEEA